MVGLGLRLEEDLARACRVRAVGGRAAVLDDPRVAAGVGVVDVEAAAARVVGREGHREQALLAARDDLVADVEERGGELAPAAHHADRATLLDDEDPPPVAGRGGHVQRVVEAPDRDEPQPPGAALGRPCGRGSRRGGAFGRAVAVAARGRFSGRAPARAERAHQRARGERRRAGHPAAGSGWSRA